MSSIANGNLPPQVTLGPIYGCGIARPITARPVPGLNLAQIICTVMEPIHRQPAYASIRGWLEGQGDPWLDALGVSDAWWQPACLHLPALLFLAGLWDEAEVLRAVKEEAACILHRRIIEADRNARNEAWEHTALRAA